ncbi:hypothetical protein NDU88_005694, partial [Pleurodeles waltl]
QPLPVYTGRGGPRACIVALNFKSNNSSRETPSDTQTELNPEHARKQTVREAAKSSGADSVDEGDVRLAKRQV